MKLNSKINRLREYIFSLKSVVVCLSGGIDSSVLLRFCVDVLGKSNVSAFVGVAPYMISSEIDFAKSLCQKFGIELIEYDVSVESIMKSNPQQRCYFCKENIFSSACKIATHRNIATVVDGTNFDDSNEHRLGELAKIKFGVKSPFADCNFTKTDIRNLATCLNLPELNSKPSATCLMTRFQTGMNVTVDALNIVASAEVFIKSLGFNVVRVRNYKGHYEIQVGIDELNKLKTSEILKQIETYFYSQKIEDFSIAENGYQFGCMQKGN